jgi:hypothetical protein
VCKRLHRISIYRIFAQVFLSIFHYILQAYSTTDIRVLGGLGQMVV